MPDDPTTGAPGAADDAYAGPDRTDGDAGRASDGDDRAVTAAPTDPDAAPPASTTAAPAERPRPQYGEYAPEGWSWQPPADAAAPAAAPPAAAPPAVPVPAPDPVAASARPVRRVDRIVTIALLALGLVGAWNGAASLQVLPAAVQTVYDQQGVGAYTPQPWLPNLALVGTVVLLGLYAAVLGWSIARLRAGRLAFWIPLTGGVVAFVVVSVLVGIVFFTDPTFLEYVERTAPA